MKRISVLMGIYNCEGTLAEALDSLYAQTYKDFKIILCDDGSTDDTLKIAQSYADQYDNIVLIRNDKNRGLNYTLNHCLEYADTEFIARMDGDDISKPERFAIQSQFLDEHPEYGVVSTPGTYFDENGIFRINKGHGEVKPTDFVRSSPIGHAECMARTEVFKNVGGYSVSDNLLRVEDYHLWFKIYAAGYKLYQMPESLYLVRSSAASIARRNWKNRRNEMYVKYVGYKMIDLPWHYNIYILEPLLKYLLPLFIYRYLHRNRNKK
ncbi:MAG: glycosyltransferase [Rikenellaceae bacterium]